MPLPAPRQTSGPGAGVMNGAEPAFFFDAGTSNVQAGASSQCEGACRDQILLPVAKILNTGPSAGIVEGRRTGAGRFATGGKAWKGSGGFCKPGGVELGTAMAQEQLAG